MNPITNPLAPYNHKDLSIQLDTMNRESAITRLFQAAQEEDIATLSLCLRHPRGKELFQKKRSWNLLNDDDKSNNPLLVVAKTAIEKRKEKTLGAIFQHVDIDEVGTAVRQLLQEISTHDSPAWVIPLLINISLHKPEILSLSNYFNSLEDGDLQQYWYKLITTCLDHPRAAELGLNDIKTYDSFLNIVGQSQNHALISRVVEQFEKWGMLSDPSHLLRLVVHLVNNDESCTHHLRERLNKHWDCISLESIGDALCKITRSYRIHIYYPIEDDFIPSTREKELANYLFSKLPDSAMPENLVNRLIDAALSIGNVEQMKKLYPLSSTHSLTACYLIDQKIAQIIQRNRFSDEAVSALEQLTIENTKNRSLRFLLQTILVTTVGMKHIATAVISSFNLAVLPIITLLNFIDANPQVAAPFLYNLFMLGIAVVWMTLNPLGDFSNNSEIPTRLSLYPNVTASAQ